MSHALPASSPQEPRLVTDDRLCNTPPLSPFPKAHHYAKCEQWEPATRGELVKMNKYTSNTHCSSLKLQDCVLPLVITTTQPQKMSGTCRCKRIHVVVMNIHAHMDPACIHFTSAKFGDVQQVDLEVMSTDLLWLAPCCTE
jgi:hypothetical protein